ncbi:MAG: oligosaccharide flippase family protein [Bacteroidales bacterium]|nr:oligosaccharide flippase family protein [Bacteroidales bacterium]
MKPAAKSQRALKEMHLTLINLGNINFRRYYSKLKIKTVGPHELSALYFKQAGAFTVIKFLSILISIIYVPIVLGYLDQEKYGIWITLTTIVGWIQLLELGMGGGLRNKLAEALALKQYQKGRVFISTTYVLVGGIFLITLVVFYLINPLLNWNKILNTTLISSSELHTLSNIVVTFIILGIILRPATIVYTAHGRTSVSGVVQLIISLTNLLLIWLVSFFSTKGNIILLATILTGVPVLVYIVFSAYTFFFKYPDLRPSFKLIQIKESEGLVRLSMQFFVVTLTATIVYSSVPFVITQLFSPNEVAVYSIANSIFNLPIMLIGLITTPVLPLVTQAFARQDLSWIRSMLRKMNVFSLVLVVGTIIMIIISPIIYRIWIGTKLSVPFGLSVTVGIYAIINILTTPFSTFINGVGKVRILTILAPLGITIYLGSAILFSKLLNNVIGVPIALSISSLIGLVAIPLTLNKYLKRPEHKN